MTNRRNPLVQALLQSKEAPRLQSFETIGHKEGAELRYRLLDKTPGGIEYIKASGPLSFVMRFVGAN